MKNPCAAAATIDPTLITRPANTRLGAGDRPELIKEGEQLWRSGPHAKSVCHRKCLGRIRRGPLVRESIRVCIPSLADAPAPSVHLTALRDARPPPSPIFGGDQRYHVLRVEHRSFILFECGGRR